jgi:hypothetical protein
MENHGEEGPKRSKRVSAGGRVLWWWWARSEATQIKWAL